MENSKLNIVGIGCDFQLEADDSPRKLAIESLTGNERDRVEWMINNMGENKVFKYKSLNKNFEEKKLLLENLKNDYLSYRKNWTLQPKNAVKGLTNISDLKKEKINPLCFDLEVASICDLACGFCYRQYVSTPDKIMKKELAFELIDQAAELNIPSMKFNWRGEPLLNPQLPEIIDYAKKKGVLETIINTNATKLNTETSKKIINSGLDILIYSFDGGSKNL